MKITYRILSGMDMITTYWDNLEERLIDACRGYYYYDSQTDGRYIPCKRKEELTGRWKTITDKGNGDVDMRIEVKYTTTWETIKPSYVEVIEEPEVYYETMWKFFKVRKYTEGKFNRIPPEVIQHSKEKLMWVREHSIEFFETKEDSDYEIVINECGV